MERCSGRRRRVGVMMEASDLVCSARMGVESPRLRIFSVNESINGRWGDEGGWRWWRGETGGGDETRKR